MKKEETSDLGEAREFINSNGDIFKRNLKLIVNSLIEESWSQAFSPSFLNEAWLSLNKTSAATPPATESQSGSLTKTTASKSQKHTPSPSFTSKIVLEERKTSAHALNNNTGSTGTNSNDPSQQQLVVLGVKSKAFGRGSQPNDEYSMINRKYSVASSRRENSAKKTQRIEKSSSRQDSGSKISRKIDSMSFMDSKNDHSDLQASRFSSGSANAFMPDRSKIKREPSQSYLTYADPIPHVSMISSCFELFQWGIEFGTVLFGFQCL